MIEIITAKGESWTQTLGQSSDGRFVLRSEGRYRSQRSVRSLNLDDAYGWLGSVKYCVDPAESKAAWEVIRAAQFAD